MSVRWLGRGEVRFWQHDPQRRAALGSRWPAAHPTPLGFDIRTRAPGPTQGEDSVLSHTEPWVEVLGHAVDWFSVALVLRAT